ncbi:hypothetical protein LCGC14_1754680 [marine sediment metagenome]|uniref:Uncharacterized protein n=1 Tax=marine sediment metagenome TaxID=412755 RepID=A0A0F9HQ80_9ZZZZ
MNPQVKLIYKILLTGGKVEDFAQVPNNGYMIWLEPNPKLTTNDRFRMFGSNAKWIEIFIHPDTKGFYKEYYDKL